MQNAVMFPKASLEPRWRLVMVLLVSAALHLVLLIAYPPFWPAEQAPQPELKDWRVDVTVALRGEVIPSAASPLRPEKVRSTGSAAHTAAPVLLESSVTQAVASTPQPAPSSRHQPVAPVTAQPAEEQAVEQHQAAQQQVQAFAGAMNSQVNMQYILSRIKTFYALTQDQIQSAARALLTEEQMRHYAGAACTATLSYATAGGEEGVQLDCADRPELADILSSGINWRALPQPQTYALEYRSMTITVWFDGYQIRVGLKSEG